MTTQQSRTLTAALLILGAVLVNIPFTLLIMVFDYPDILREPTSVILTRFAAGGPNLIWTWLAFAWVGLPILLGIVLLPQALADDAAPDRAQLLGRAAQFFGAFGAVAQMLGLLRWAFVVPILARLYTDPQASAATREAVAAVFQVVHQYGGVVLGEHIGQSFTILWMILLSISMLTDRRFPRWFSIAGFAAAGIYVLAQGELLATVMPGFPVWGDAGMIGSLLWLAWLVVLGILVIRLKESNDEHARQDSRRSISTLQRAGNHEGIN